MSLLCAVSLEPSLLAYTQIKLRPLAQLDTSSLDWLQSLKDFFHQCVISYTCS